MRDFSDLRGGCRGLSFSCERDNPGKALATRIEIVFGHLLGWSSTSKLALLKVKRMETSFWGVVVCLNYLCFDLFPEINYDRRAFTSR